MKDYPVNIQVISRFRTPKESKQILEDVKAGRVDILIGTHRLLSGDVEFKNLGLIVVDEEQRFGVLHKEKLKQNWAEVDVMTLTATPIPRTLHMSLAGIRDMSILNEPPLERRPIQTYVLEYSPEMVRSAIMRELSRGGQVYYLHNRVQNIAAAADRVQKLIPEAQIAYAHGRMGERELENVMMDFVDGSIDVLVCTTIVESGLDIPNVNTIIIQDADFLGLAQLYQLRGRVGRSGRSSFAYLMYRKDKVLTEVAEKRLQTIREFTEFGAGFKIAMRDLEIRGAGNLLGTSQHGHMDAVGYEMYCKLLDLAVRELRGMEIPKDFETLVDLSLDAFIPSNFIPHEATRLEIYKKISHITNQADYYDVQEEIEDRFGTLPPSAQNLLDIALLKARAHALDILSIKQGPKAVIMTFKPDAKADPMAIANAVSTSKGRLKFTLGTNPSLAYHITENEEIITPLTETIQSLGAK
jgi:transcription-repair coupling factor (superfamily II helicase)